MQVDVERRRCVRVVDTHTSPARVTCLFNARPIEQLCVFCVESVIIVSVRKRDRRVKGEEEREIVEGVHLGCRIRSQDQNICARWMPAITIMLTESRNPHVSGQHDAP